MGLRTREKAMLVAIAVLLLTLGWTEIRRLRARASVAEALVRLAEVDAAARAWQAEASSIDSLLERERMERQLLWEEHDSLAVIYDSLLNAQQHAHPRPPRTAPALRQSILRATRER